MWRKRIGHVFVLAMLLGIGSRLHSCATPLQALPSGAGEWSMRGTVHCAAPVAADLVWRGTAGARRVCRATYTGPAEMALTVYDMPDLPGATPFDALQKWQSQPGRMAFFQGRYFGVAESPGADMQTLSRFLTAFTSALLPGTGEFHR